MVRWIEAHQMLPLHPSGQHLCKLGRRTMDGRVDRRFIDPTKFRVPLARYPSSDTNSGGQTRPYCTRKQILNSQKHDLLVPLLASAAMFLERSNR